MNKNTSQIEEMKRYLFYEMSEEESEILEERFFEDHEYFEDLVELENDLIDSYAVKKLSGEDLIRFEKSLANSPERREKVAEARALQTIIQEERPTIKSEPQTVAAPVGFWEKIAAFFNVQASAMKLAAGALIILIVCAIGFLLYRDWQKRVEYANDENRQRLIQEREEKQNLDKQYEAELERIRREQQNLNSQVDKVENSNTVLEKKSELDQKEQEIIKKQNRTRNEKEQLDKKLIVPVTPKNEVKPRNEVIALIVSPIGGGTRGGGSPVCTFVSKDGNSKTICSVSVPIDQTYTSIEITGVGANEGKKIGSRPIGKGVETITFELPSDVREIELKAIPQNPESLGPTRMGKFKLETP